MAVFYYIITYTYKLKFNYRAILISILSLIILLNFDLLNQSLGFLNLQIHNFAAESVNYIPSKMEKLKVIEIGFNLESMFNILISIFQFFFRPYPWSTGANIFVYIQSVENIIVIIIKLLQQC